MNPPAEAWPGAPWIFWISFAFIFYTYALYPMLAALVARMRPRPVARAADFSPTVSVIVAAHNEADNIAARIENLLEQQYPSENFELIVVSDGSTDNTAEIIDSLSMQSTPSTMSTSSTLRAICLPNNQGKATALNGAVATATGDLLIFTDARQRFAPDAVARLAENFADPNVGSTSGELMLEGGAGVAAQVGLYWKYEKWIRRSESDAGSMLGATGAIYAIRRELWRPLPEGTILDDFLVPMRIVLAGRRAIWDGRAIAFDRAETAAGREFRRKVRTLAGNFQAFAIEPALLLPWRNPATWIQVWSHKVFRLLVPYALLALFASAPLAAGSFYTVAALAQSVFYTAAALGCVAERRGKPPLSRAINLAYTFSTLNAAAAVGLLRCLQGRSTNDLWRR